MDPQREKEKKNKKDKGAEKKNGKRKDKREREKSEEERERTREKREKSEEKKKENGLRMDAPRGGVQAPRPVAKRGQWPCPSAEAQRSMAKQQATFRENNVFFMLLCFLSDFGGQPGPGLALPMFCKRF